MKKRKGQFYIIAAVIIVLVLSGIYLTRNYIRGEEEPSEFYNLAEELNLESGRVIDYGIYSEGNINELLDSFTDQYLEYSENKINAGDWVFVYGDESEMTVTTLSRRESGTIGVDIGGVQNTIDIKTTELTRVPAFIGPGGEVKLEVFGQEYEFKVYKGKRFYFLIGSGGEYIEKNE